MQRSIDANDPHQIRRTFIKLSEKMLRTLFIGMVLLAVAAGESLIGDPLSDTLFS